MCRSFLSGDHIERIVKACEKFKDEPSLARVASLEEIRAWDGCLCIPRCVTPQAIVGPSPGKESKTSLPLALAARLESSARVRTSLRELLANVPSPAKNRAR